MAKAVQALRVDFSNAPASVLKTLYGDAKDKQNIFAAIQQIGALTDKKGAVINPAVHAKEIFHYINTDEKGEWILNAQGEPAIGMQSLTRQLTSLVDTGQIERVGERTGRYILTDAADIEDDEADTE